MWATDATQIPTVQDGKVWLFVVVEHWNAEALGWHVAEKADRFAAAQALDLAIHNASSAVRADAARGLVLRHDHGSAFMADHFQNQIAFLGMTPSFAFVRQPETNGVIERFFRTLKEQVVQGRIFQQSTRFATPSAPSSPAITTTGCWRRMPTAALLRPGANGSPHSPQ